MTKHVKAAAVLAAAAILSEPLRFEDYSLSREQWEHLIEQWIFSEIDRAILRRKLLDGITFEQLAEELSLSVQAVKARYYPALDRLLISTEK